MNLGLKMDFKENLKTNISRELKRKSIEKRMFNIEALSNIHRDGLEFGKKERMLLLYETAYGEKIYIQYPGKESKSNKKSNIRPWDFRPKMILADGNYLKDLSFKDIWDDLIQQHELECEVINILAAVFFRMALMIDVKKEEDYYEYTDIDSESKLKIGVGEEKLSWYKYSIDREVLRYLEEMIGGIRGVSVEAYLYYNYLLVLNEDCKYYYRDKYVKDKKWESNVGMYNTLLTHIEVIGYLQGNIKFSEIMNKFQNGRGVAPATQDLVCKITDNIISKKDKLIKIKECII